MQPRGQSRLSRANPSCHEKFLDRSNTQFAMRTEADKLQGMITDFAIDENEVAAQMAVTEIPPLAAERVIEGPPRQREIVGEHVNSALEQAVEVTAVDAAFLTPEVAAKARGLLNPPH